MPKSRGVLTDRSFSLAGVATIRTCSPADVPQPTEQVASGRKIRRHILEEARGLSANHRQVLSLIRIHKQPDVHAQPVVILKCSEFSPTRQVLLAGAHATRLRRPARVGSAIAPRDCTDAL